jgi:hypothetical protein
MFAHVLNPLKGWPSPTALDFIGKLHSAITIDPLPGGRCVHIYGYEAVTYGPGTSGPVPLLKTGVVGTQMGIFLLQGSADFDVSNSGGTTWYAIAPKGIVSGLVAKGAYELETTEFETGQTYLPNQPLRAISDDTNSTAGTGGGCLTNQGFTFATNAFVGVVSRGKYTNAYGQTALAFWPVYQPTASA